MEQLTIVGTEGTTLVLANEHGQRFTLEIDDMLRGEVRRTRAITEPKPPAKGPNPRDIQAHIRAGLSAEEVAELLECDVERVRPFEGPVLAEREHIVDRALAMPVLRSVQVGLEENPTFGTVIREKLADLSAMSERWTSWKAEEGWVIKLTFEAGGIERDARWTYDPRRSALAPANDDATQLSRQGKVQDGLIPRLRALDAVEDQKDVSTFDEQSFHEDAPQPEPEPERVSDTADLLEALRRKRGQREPAASDERTEEPSARPVALLNSSEEGAKAPSESDEQPEADASSNSGDSAKRRRRPSMPSWDEIVFGARGDDQP
ncbi:DNA-binding protein [Microbacterium nanhaiense]|uniref:DNA-binding protein n=1 Tax=Microbacterium nanhaiense TaxID=1301026 RepID=A0ABQ2MYH7_9MICO|nr:septation protein SepH [Microbacterium nanhaiense]GGO60021.1 DNA-binding protein [Microbacterium nanhaiense]